MTIIRYYDTYEHGTSRRLLLAALEEAKLLTEAEAACAQFEELPGGKPRLKDRPEICFNLSHSGNRFVCAISETPLGIDLERIDRRLHFDGEQPAEWEEKIARRVCGHEELRLYGQGLSFAELWSAKEAVVKYTGAGLSGMHSHFVDGGAGSPAAWRQAVLGAGLTLALPDGSRACLQRIEAAQSGNDVCFLCSGRKEDIHCSKLTEML